MTADSQAPICESLLHRLIDDEPQKQSLTQAQGAISVDTLYDRIRSNLEKILNTRKVPIKNLSSYQHLPSSLLQYGTPDFCHSYYGSKPAQKKLCKEILSLNKKVFISLGMHKNLSSLPYKGKNITYFYCVSKYPTRLDELKMPNFEKRLRVWLDWNIDLFFRRDISRYGFKRNILKEYQELDEVDDVW